jgi:hypothetical protein
MMKKRSSPGMGAKAAAAIPIRVVAQKSACNVNRMRGIAIAAFVGYEYFAARG